MFTRVYFKEAIVFIILQMFGNRRGLSFQHSRPSSLPARVAFRAKHHSAASDEGRCFCRLAQL